MPPTKRKAVPAPSASKGKGRALAPAPSKRPKLAANKPSNRPNYGGYSSPSSGSGSDSSGESSADERHSDEDEQAAAAREARRAAFEEYQQQFLAEAMPYASTSKSRVEDATGGKGKEAKSVWEMDMGDLDDEEDSEESGEEESEAEEEQEAFETPGRASAVQVVAFAEPGRGDTPGAQAALDKKDIRDFKAGKIKNLHVKPSIADAANVKYVGGKAKAKARAAAAGKAGAAATPEQAAADAAQESHLDKLDSHLSALIKPLTNASTPASLPDLLRDLPLEPKKALKGHTPLPKNAPRTLRRGQNAANLKRAQARDAAAGNAAGSKKGREGMGREALSLKEKRKAEGGDKRQRGLGAAVGKWGRGQISLSKHEIRRVERS
ncbi:hypothetical protein JCM10207_004386 [Rhodosporidiobolus poonsookiae]